MDNHWYFAYGSNLSCRQMEKRTGSIGETRLARLDGYRIAFNKRSCDGTGKANIVPDSSGVVFGVIYWCSDEALSQLDDYEGVESGHYRQNLVRVKSDLGDDIEAITYIAGSSFIDDTLKPSASYLQTILQGAQHHGLPKDYISEIKQRATRA
ncbi:gamma-glutamylcyclotransferase [Gammaproteobacteria bacterium]